MNAIKETAQQLQDPVYWDVVGVILLPIVLPAACILAILYIAWIIYSVHVYKRELCVHFDNEDCGE